MTEAPAPPLRSASTAPDDVKMPPEMAVRIRQLSHDLSNALEIVLQASYLLGMAPNGEDGEKWRAMIDQGVQKAAEINLQLRDYIRACS